MNLTDKEKSELFYLPQPTWMVMVLSKTHKYLHKLYARSLNSTGACKAVRDNTVIKSGCYLKAHMVNANDSRISWEQWTAYLERVGRGQEATRLNNYREMVASGGR